MPTSPPAAPAAAVHYHVSDHLCDRHPYGVGTAGTAGPTATVPPSPVVDGFMNVGLEELVARVASADLDPIPRAKAVRLLLARSMPAEAKVDMAKRGVVKVVAAALMAPNSKGPLLPQGEAFAAQLLRSIALVPAGAYAVIADGGLAALVARLADRSGGAERQAARAAELGALQLLASAWNTREWVLGIAGEDESMRVTAARAESQADRDALAARTCQTVVGVVAGEAAATALLVPAAVTLSLLTASPSGASAALAAGGLEACVAVAKRLADVGVNSAEEEVAGTSAVTSIWNMCMDARGKAKCTDLPVVHTLGYLLSVLLAATGKHRLKAAVAGAMGAASIHVPVKPHALDVLPSAMAMPPSKSHMLMRASATPLGRLVVLLQESNDAYVPLFEARRQNHVLPAEHAARFDELAAAIKNAVHCIRIVAELPAARAELLPFLVPEGATGPMATSGVPLMLRRQLFYETDFAAEFRVPSV